MDSYINKGEKIFQGEKQTHNYKNFVTSHTYPRHQRLSRHDYYNMDGNVDNTRDLNFAEQSSDSTNYLEYPASKPFINTGYTGMDTPINPYVVSDGNALINALAQIQEKIKSLEIERKAAEKNLHSLTTEKEQYKQILTNDKPVGSTGTHQNDRPERDKDVLGHTREVEGQLSSAEHRCQRLEKQLQKMRTLMENTKTNQEKLMEKLGKTGQEKDLSGVDIRQHIDRLNELERDQTRLTITQTLAESKIRVLEKKIQEEKLHRTAIEEKTIQLESKAHSKKVLPNRETPSPTEARIGPTRTLRTKKTAKKKKKSPPFSVPAGTCRSEPKRHYRLNLAEIPFVAGKSTGPSHALGANVQKVLAMMKLHNSALCSNGHRNEDCQRSESASSTGSSVTSTDNDFSELLLQLQDEFGQISSSHQEILELLHITREPKDKEKLKEELDVLVTSMENKSQQIFTIRQHQKKIEESRKVRATQFTKTEKPKKIQTTGSHRHHHSQHTSDIHRSRPRSHSHCKPVGHSALGRPELFMLRDMKKLQTTLRKDNLC